MRTWSLWVGVAALAMALALVPSGTPIEPLRVERTGSVTAAAMEDLLQGAALLLAQTVQLACDAITTADVRRLERVEAELSKARLETSRAEARLDAKEYDLAILHYEKAWLHASVAASLGNPVNN